MVGNGTGTGDHRPAPPSSYTPEAKQLWADVIDGWSIDRPLLKVVSILCESLMRMRQAQTILAREGLQTKDRFGQVKAHPMVLVERDAMNTFLAAMKHLNLDIEPLRDRMGRPPTSGAY